MFWAVPSIDLSNIQRKVLRNTANQTWGCWVQSENDSQCAMWPPSFGNLSASKKFASKLLRLGLARQDQDGKFFFFEILKMNSYVTCGPICRKGLMNKLQKDGEGGRAEGSRTPPPPPTPTTTTTVTTTSLATSATTGLAGWLSGWGPLWNEQFHLLNIFYTKIEG